ncbi:MAG TPA: hypothetical protein VF593_05375 [Chthoniobacteraceae bacterium]
MHAEDSWKFGSQSCHVNIKDIHGLKEIDFPTAAPETSLRMAEELPNQSPRSELH